MRRTAPLLGVEPLPLLADYAQVFADYEVYLAERDGALDGVLILEPRADDLLIWSVAVGARGARPRRRQHDARRSPKRARASSG